MRVAIVTESAEADAVRGIGVYTRELFNELKKREDKDFKIDIVKSGDRKLANYQIHHYPDFRVYFSLPELFKGVKTIVTIHDVIPLLYPKQYPAGIKGTLKLFQQKLLLKKVSHVITVSETSKKDIVRTLGVPVDKIEMVYEAPKEIYKTDRLDSKKKDEIKRKYKLPAEFVLYVGDVNYNKNVIGLAKACGLAKIPLVVVGKQAVHEDVDFSHLENRSFLELIGLAKNSKDIFRIGFVPDGDLLYIYKLATLYFQPSFYEGFGLSVLEAFASRTPAVVSKTQALVEIVDNVALIADPYSPDDMASKIETIRNDKKIRDSLIKSGEERVRFFSWQKASKQTLALYKKVSETPRP